MVQRLAIHAGSLSALGMSVVGPHSINLHVCMWIESRVSQGLCLEVGMMTLPYRLDPLVSRLRLSGGVQCLTKADTFMSRPRVSRKGS